MLSITTVIVKSEVTSVLYASTLKIGIQSGECNIQLRIRFVQLAFFQDILK